jgi:glycosyltransferase involved in cell wall biosynthesis
LGQQFRYKGVGAMLEAAPLVWQQHPEITFVFIGPQTRYSNGIFAGVNDPRIRNLGPLDLETKTSALAACEFLCLPSSQESFGGVYVEAWAMGKAVVGGRIAPVAELISEGKEGLLSSQDAGELASQISLLLANPQLCAKMGAAGAERVHARYTWARIAKQTADIYEGLR